MCVCVCVCDISSLRVNGPSEPGRLRDVCVCQWVNPGHTLTSYTCNINLNTDLHVRLGLPSCFSSLHFPTKYLYVYSEV